MEVNVTEYCFLSLLTLVAVLSGCGSAQMRPTKLTASASVTTPSRAVIEAPTAAPTAAVAPTHPPATATSWPTSVPCRDYDIRLPEPAPFAPVPTPVGSAIAYSNASGGFDLLFPDTGATAAIHVVQREGQMIEADRGLAWSPDGRRIAMVVPAAGGPKATQIALYDVQARALTRLPVVPCLGELAWGPR